jgi:NAD(P)-dependent dehydrogenase (short-subunit alcohol dehydrogenase family)
MFSHDDFEILEEDIHSSFNIRTIEAFLPLIQAATGERKVITIPAACPTSTSPTQPIDLAPAYAISKAGVNVADAKYSALYKNEGILFMSVCPGNVATERQTRGKPTHQ